MSESYQYKFVGRQSAIDAFHALRSLREQKNALYVEADGGLGKTRLLQEYINQCKQQRRPWHVGPSYTDEAIIDFSARQNRTVAGLRRSIAQRLGWQHFRDFQAKEVELQQAETALKSGGSGEKSKVAALQLETESAFFQEFKKALREVRNYSALFFDTFETAYTERVGRWFLEEFLPNPATTGGLIVFAGRRRPFDLPLNVSRYKLAEFNPIEAAEYFRVRYKSHFEEPEQTMREISKGNPLMMDLAVHYRQELDGQIKIPS